VISSSKPALNQARSAFSLTEMVAVIAVTLILLTAGISLIGNTGAQARKSATDQIIGLIEQARTAAITSRSTVFLVVAEPGDLPAGDERCRLGLFRAEGEWKPGSTGPIPATLLSRWTPLETGVVLIDGQVDGVGNPLGGDELTITYKTNNSHSVKVHALAFNSRGGLVYPAGSTPVGMRIAEGAYRNGKASPNQRGDSGAIAENRLKIGRVTARPYRIDG
jgi:type II secretory pathway pseudopilin PulG